MLNKTNQKPIRRKCIYAGNNSTPNFKRFTNTQYPKGKNLESGIQSRKSVIF